MENKTDLFKEALENSDHNLLVTEEENFKLRAALRQAQEALSEIENIIGGCAMGVHNAHVKSHVLTLIRESRS